jgi:DNA-directed RNA polymerase subunit RPC12/RpoP
MKCLNCQTENPETAKFCIEYSATMEFHCPKCGVLTIKEEV